MFLILQFSPDFFSRLSHRLYSSLALKFRKTVPVNKDAELDMAAYKTSLSPDTALVTLMWANNETGAIFPIEEAAQMAREKGIPFHTDAVQAVGKIPINLKECAVDMLSLSGHKLHGPKGIGVMYLRQGIPFHPLLIGGHQEEGRRGGIYAAL